MEILEQAAAQRVVLEAQRIVEVGAVHHALLGEDPPRPARNLRADRHAAMAVLHPASLNDDVLRRHLHAPAVGVASGLDRDAVVARVEEAVRDQHVFARLRIAAVGVRAICLDVEILDGDVGAQHRVDLPHRRVEHADAFDQHVRAAVRLDELRAQVVAGAEDAVLDRHAALRHVEERVAVGILIDVALLPAAVRAAFPRPPVRAVAVAVDRAAAGDRDVRLLEGVDERREVHQLGAFPPRQHDGVFVGVARETDRRPLADVQVDAAFQLDRAGDEFAFRHDDASAACANTGGDSAAEGLGVRPRVAAGRAECGDVEIAGGESWRPDARENLGQLPPWIAAALRAEPERRPVPSDNRAGGEGLQKRTAVRHGTGTRAGRFRYRAAL